MFQMVRQDLAQSRHDLALLAGEYVIVDPNYDATLKSRSWTKASSRNPVFLRGSVEKADF